MANGRLTPFQKRRTAGVPRPFMLICPGGGYQALEAMAEDFPVAKKLNEMGINAFSLKYRVGMDGVAKKADEDLHAALRYILAHHKEFHVDEGYAVMGFSASGHLACGFGSDNRGYQEADLPKPQMLCLCYAPVSLLLEKDPERSLNRAQRMLGDNATQEDLRANSPLEHSGEGFPPAFIWHSLEDEVVSPKKCTAFGQKTQRAQHCASAL